MCECLYVSVFVHVCCVSILGEYTYINNNEQTYAFVVSIFDTINRLILAKCSGSAIMASHIFVVLFVVVILFVIKALTEMITYTAREIIFHHAHDCHLVHFVTTRQKCNAHCSVSLYIFFTFL